MVKQNSRWPDRQISPHEGRLKRKNLLCEMEGWNQRLIKDVTSQLSSLEEMQVVGFLLDMLSDVEDPCGWVCVENRALPGRISLFVTDFEFDRDLVDALESRFGRELVLASMKWLTEWVRTSEVPFHWICWRLGRIRMSGARSRSFVIEVDHVLYDLHAYPAAKGVTLLDGPTHASSTLLPFPSWKDV